MGQQRSLDHVDGRDEVCVGGGDDAVGVEVDVTVEARSVAGEYQPDTTPGAEADHADALIDEGCRPQEIECALKVAVGLGIGAVAQPFPGLADVLFLDHGGEIVTAVKGGQDGGIAVDGKAAGDILEVFLIAVDAVDDDDAGVLGLHQLGEPHRQEPGRR